MRMINTTVPNTSWDLPKAPKRREAAYYKLSKISDIIAASGDAIKSIPIASELRLGPDDLELVIRAFKEVKVPTKDNSIVVKEWGENLHASDKYQDILVPYLNILTSPVTHTTICNIKQIDKPRYSVASSAIMLAAREAQNIPYSYWLNTVVDSPHGRLGFDRLFFKSFADALKNVDPVIYDSVEITEEDKDYLVKGGNPRGWYLNKFDKEHLMPGTNWHYYIKHMKVGTWIFHESVRDENSMIFHPRDWDFVPKCTGNRFVKSNEKDDFGDLF